MPNPIADTRIGFFGEGWGISSLDVTRLLFATHPSDRVYFIHSSGGGQSVPYGLFRTTDIGGAPLPRDSSGREFPRDIAGKFFSINVGSGLSFGGLQQIELLAKSVTGRQDTLYHWTGMLHLASTFPGGTSISGIAKALRNYYIYALPPVPRISFHDKLQYPFVGNIVFLDEATALRVVMFGQDPPWDAPSVWP